MRRLLVRYGVAMASVVLVAFLVPLGLLARSLAEERALTAARQDAQRVVVFVGSQDDEARLEGELLAVNTGERRTTVFQPDGTSLGAPAEVTPSVRLAASGQALTARTEGGAEVLLPVGGPDGVGVVRTFVPDAELTEGVTQAWVMLTLVGLVLLAGTAVAGHRIATRLSRSVQDLAETADRLGAGDLAARVEPSGPPEVASVGAVLNGLGSRVAGLLADERELVADLSHRLRTPITALRLEADLLEDAEERRRMTEHVEALVAAVDEIIHAAREHGERSVQVTCDAADVVRARAAFWGVLAADQGRALEVSLAEGRAAVATDTAELGAALDVLVDNVFRHTAAGTAFAIAVERDGDRVRVVVTDDGDGFGDRTVQRGVSGSGSTGIGMDVARRTAEQAGGRLVVEPGTGGRGTRVVLEMAAAEPAG